MQIPDGSVDESTKYFVLFGFITSTILLLAVVYKSDDKITTKSKFNENFSSIAESENLKTLSL